MPESHNGAKAGPKALVIVGPTASGKSALAVRLAKRLNGEVISADSRQVYKGLDLGTGKVTRREMGGIRHHLLDVADPRRPFTAERYRRLARRAMDDIVARGKLPIICGGTGFYIDAIFNDGFPAVGPDHALRKRLQEESLPGLLRKLKKLDPGRWRALTSNRSERNNRVRIIRSIEIAEGRPTDSPAASRIAPGHATKTALLPEYTTTVIGIKLTKEALQRRIRSRLMERLRRGMLSEARRLHARGLSWKRMEELGLEYRYMSRYLRGMMTKEEMTEKLCTEIWHYAKRQMTWFKRDKSIRWTENPRQLRPPRIS